MSELISRNDIAVRIAGLQREISDFHTDNYYYEGAVFVSVLNGSFMFMADLMRDMSIYQSEVDFVQVQSYVGKSNAGGCKLIKDVSCDLADKVVYLVDDIIESGNTFDFLRKHIEKKFDPIDIKTVALLSRSGGRQADFNGFEIGPDWVYGYGLDRNGFDRNLPAIYIE